MSESNTRKPQTPRWDIVNPATGQVDLVGAMRHAIKILHEAGAVQEGLHYFVICRLHQTLEDAGFDKSKAIVLSALLQKIGLIRRLTKINHSEGTFYKWWVIDPSFTEMLLHPEVVEAGKRADIAHIETRSRILQLENALQAAKAAGRTETPSVGAPSEGVDSDVMAEIGQTIAALEEQTRRGDVAEARVAELTAEVEKLKHGPTALAQAIAMARNGALGQKASGGGGGST